MIETQSTRKHKVGKIKALREWVKAFLGVVALDLNLEMHIGTSQVEKQKKECVQSHEVKKHVMFVELHVGYIAGLQSMDGGVEMNLF